MKILFVCTANICRSALAEAILKKMLKEKGLTDIEVASTDSMRSALMSKPT